MSPCPSRRSLRVAVAPLLVALTLAGCSDGGSGSTGTAAGSVAASSGGSATAWPTGSGRLSDEDSRAVFDRAAAAVSAQRTMAVTFVAERTDGYCLPQILNPTIRLDLRDPNAPAASLALSILATNVATGGKVYRQQADPTGESTVWVIDPEPRTPLEFVLWKPAVRGVAVAALGTDQVAGQAARHYRVYDPLSYAGPTTGVLSSSGTASSGPAASPTPCRPLPAASGTASASGASGTASGAATGVGDYDDFWLGEDGIVLRMVSVLGELRLTSTTITYGGGLRVDVPDVSKAITQQEYESRQAGQPAPTSGRG